MFLMSFQKNVKHRACSLIFLLRTKEHTSFTDWHRVLSLRENALRSTSCESCPTPGTKYACPLILACLPILQHCEKQISIMYEYNLRSISYFLK